MMLEELVELTLHLHSNSQIKAKNYDKVEKVSQTHTSPLAQKILTSVSDWLILWQVKFFFNLN